jgi:hypothetical protein
VDHTTIIDLLTERGAARARDFVLAWGERRNASWLNAAREAAARCGSIDHLPQIRGQLRYHLGEVALAEAAAKAEIGFIPLKTKPAGGVFNVARVGRFALASVTVPAKYAVPRDSVTRRMLSEPNEDLEPQTRLIEKTTGKRAATELAYFGCVIAIPWKRDPTVPASLVLAVPNKTLTHWISWIPLHRAYTLIQERVDATQPTSSRELGIPDNVFPKVRIPKPGQAEDDKTA